MHKYVNELPDSHAWAWSKTSIGLSPDDHCLFKLPVIDFSDSNNGSKHVIHGYKTWGAFLTTSHGISVQQIGSTSDLQS